MDFGQRILKTVVLYTLKITRQKEKYLSDTKEALKLIEFSIKHTSYRTNDFPFLSLNIIVDEVPH